MSGAPSHAESGTARAQTTAAPMLEGLRAERRLRQRAGGARPLDEAWRTGEVVALLGANGAGKTTTLRAISGLVKVVSGSDPAGRRGLARRVAPGAARTAGIAHVPEGRGIFFGLTVGEHFGIGVRPSAADVEEVVRVLPRAARPPRAAAPGCSPAASSRSRGSPVPLIHKPKLLLLDELSLGLAPVDRRAAAAGRPAVRRTHARPPWCWSSSTSGSGSRSQTARTCSPTAP